MANFAISLSWQMAWNLLGKVVQCFSRASHGRSEVLYACSVIKANLLHGSCFCRFMRTPCFIKQGF